MDEDCVEELFDFFSESEDESIEGAIAEFDDSYSGRVEVCENKVPERYRNQVASNSSLLANCVEGH